MCSISWFLRFKCHDNRLSATAIGLLARNYRWYKDFVAFRCL
uniref:Uncharacterized protein n=1 Tax=Rhizophora mucronata TaxID=61149 RepID=A0A2P2NN91_RHIMU